MNSSQTPSYGGARVALHRVALWFSLSMAGVILAQLLLFAAHEDAAANAARSRDIARAARSALLVAGERSRAALRRAKRPSVEDVASHDAALLVEASGPSFDSLAALTNDDVVQHRRARALREAYARWAAAVAPLETTGAPPTASQFGAEERAYDALRTLAAQLVAVEEGRRIEQARRDALVERLALAAVVLPLSLIGALFWRATRRHGAQQAELARQRDHLEEQATALEEQAIELEQQVEELSVANGALVQSNAATVRAQRETERENTERLRNAAIIDAALASVPVAVAVIDRDLRYVKVNAACAVMTGRPLEEHAGRTLREVNPLLDAGLEEAMRTVLRTGEPRLNLRIVRPTPHAKTGSLEVVMHITPYRGPSGEIEGICSTATDLSEWKSLQDQLHQAQKLESVGRLSAGIAHDFNNLLTVIATYCDLVLMELATGSRYRAEVEAIRNAAARASTLARRMLGATRSKAVIAKPVDLDEIVAEARDLVGHAAREGVMIEFAADGRAGVVVADPTQLEQVLMNLVINAVDAMPGGGRVAVRTAARDLPAPRQTSTGELPAGAYAELTVADTGEGMDAATLARIFEPFFTTKPRGKGTGLGLATVFGIVRDLHGGVDVTSAPGLGTTFRVLLPRVPEEEGSAPRRVREAERADLPRGSETLLVVEDEDALRSSITRLFSRQGYRVLEARHGGEALRILAETEHIDLVVSDLHMPGVGGRELSARMRAAGRVTPLLLMSGSSGTGTDDAAWDDTAASPPPEGPHRFIGKPFAIEEVLTTVRAMLETP